MAFPKFLTDFLKATTTTAANSALQSEPLRTLVTDTELLAGTATTVRGFTPLMLKGVANRAGTTAARPTTASVGFGYFDTTLGKPVWLKTAPSAWVDSAGVTA